MEQTNATTAATAEKKAEPLEIIKGVSSFLSKPTNSNARALFEDFFFRGTIGLLDGMGEAGKSRLLLQMALCLAAGIKFLAWPAVRPARVLFLAAEDPLDELHRRIHYILCALIEKGEHDFEEKEIIARANQNFHLVNFHEVKISPMLARRSGRGSLAQTELYSWLMKQCEEIKPEMLVLDPLNLFCPASETENECAIEFYSMLKQLGCAVFMNTHQSKAAMNSADMNQRARARGASALTENARTHLSLENDTLICDKNNYVHYSRSHFRLDLTRGDIWRPVGMPNYERETATKAKQMKHRPGGAI